MNRFEFNFAPFDVLTNDEKASLQKAFQIVFFDDNAEIVKAGESSECLYVVAKGVVKEVGTDGELLAVYHANQSFDSRTLFEPVCHHSFVVAEQALLYAIPKAVIVGLVGKNDRFGAYFYANIAERLANLSVSQNEQTFAHLLHARVSDAYANRTVWVDDSPTLVQVAQFMKDKKVKSVLVKDDDKVGLLTEAVFRDVVAMGADTQDLAKNWANFRLIGVELDDFLFNAMIAMMHRRVQRLVVYDNGQVVGLLEQVDILAYLSNHSHFVAESLEQADSLEKLAQIASGFDEMIATLQASGMQAIQLAQLMQVLNARLFEKTWALIAPAELVAKSCLIVMGSEGRGEQVLKTDQDNALIVADDVPIETVRPFADEFSQMLAKFGYPPCQGGVMVNNPKWCQRLSDFKKTVASWCKNPNPEHLMDMAIFLDAHAVAGDDDLLVAVKSHLYAHLDKDTGLMQGFAQAVSQFDEHNQGFFAKMIGKKDTHRMDIKKMGVFPIVHGTRSLTLKASNMGDKTSTVLRLQELARQGVISKTLADDVSEALRLFMNLRLKAGLSAKKQQNFVPNQVILDNLTTLEKDLLKDALQVAKRFKHEVKSQFGMVTY